MHAESGGREVVTTLASLGLDTIFSVSGNQILPIFDAAPDAGIRIIHMRHESAAAYAAAAWSEMTGKPGVMLVSAGPGHVASFTGIAVAASMELPMICISGGSPVNLRGYGAFQEFDQQAIPTAICKAGFDVTSADDVHSSLMSAYNLATSGIPGPVHLTIPADVLNATVHNRTSVTEPAHSAKLTSNDQVTLSRMAEELGKAERPLVIARPSAGRHGRVESLWTLCRLLNIEPVITECPRALSDLKYLEIIQDYRNSDCALVIGPADFTVGFLDPGTIAEQGKVLLIDAPGEPVPARQPDLHARTDVGAALEFLIEHLADSGSVSAEWAAHWPLQPATAPEANTADGKVHPLHVALEVRHRLTSDDVVVLDGGEFCQWMRLGLRDAPCRILWSGRLGAIGGAVPMAVGVRASGHQGRVFVAAGDGGVGYHLTEIETAARYGSPMTVVVGNDGLWAAEWHQQVSRYGEDRTFDTSLLPARYDLVATGYGGTGWQVTSPEEMQRALDASLEADGPSLLNVAIAPLASPAAIH